MDLSQLPLIVGFLLAAYSVVANDVIQTLGTFLSSNDNKPWYALWGFAGSILAVVLIYGWLGGDIDYGRLDKIAIPETLSWWYVLPPLVLLFITRIGIPVSTTFLILTFFSSKALLPMLQKSVMGYVIALFSGALIFFAVAKITEKRFIESPLGSDSSLWTNKTFWTIAQWFSTAFLWSQWLTQDLANIYIYLLVGKGGTGTLETLPFVLSLIAILALLGFVFYSKGGAIQRIIKNKINTADIRSATFVDLIYGIILYIFKYNALGLWEGKLPMSTTWVFIGLLAGREIAIRFSLNTQNKNNVWREVGIDLAKVFFGLVVSIILVIIIYTVQGQELKF